MRETENGVPKLLLDNVHLNAAGCYLAGCVWYETITGLDTREIEFHPPDVDADTATFLRNTAHDVCVRYASSSP
jgi:hypothetical protein